MNTRVMNMGTTGGSGSPAWNWLAKGRGVGDSLAALAGLVVGSFGPPGPEVFRRGTTPRPSRVPAGADGQCDGVAVGEGPVRVDVYFDFLCAYCHRFEETTGPVLDGLVAEGLIKVVYHPMGFLDELSTNRYSSLAAAAAGCAADGGRFVEYAHELFAAQPAEGGPGLDDDELIRLGTRVGLPERDFARCVREGVYLEWAQYVTECALERGVAATPTVFVQGLPVPANPRPIAAAVAALTS